MPTVDSFLDACNALMRGQKPRDILQRALVRIGSPEHWTRGTRARDGAGRAVPPTSVDAVAWCLETAIALECNQYAILPPYFMRLLDGVAEREFGHISGALLFNECYGHESVVALLKMAILELPEE